MKQPCGCPQAPAFMRGVPDLYSSSRKKIFTLADAHDLCRATISIFAQISALRHFHSANAKLESASMTVKRAE